MNQIKITQDLADFYTAEADKFYNSRKKNIRPEFEHILYEINKIEKDEIYILELGCGDGRLYGFLKEYANKKIRYIWSDVSKWLIDIAKDNYPEKQWRCKRIVDDMINTTSEGKWTQKFDIVISIAAVQHIYSDQNRLVLFDNVYNITDYDGLFIMTNWSLSYWFIKKFWKLILEWFMRRLIWGQDILDIYIPRKATYKNPPQIHHRYYHIFTIKQIKDLLVQSSWKIKKIWYIDKSWSITNDWRYSRNSLTIASKNVLW